MKLIEKMYEVEAEATKARASPDARLAMRHERTSPLLDELGQWIADTDPELLPKSPLAQAMGHAMRRWTALRRVLEEGRIPLDDGESERRLRDVALGRRNDLFAGSDTGAERAAIVHSILGGCALDGVEPRGLPRRRHAAHRRRMADEPGRGDAPRQLRRHGRSRESTTSGRATAQ